MLEAVLLGSAILLVIFLISISVYLTMKPRFGPWERMIKCSEMSKEMAETAVTYRKMGMEESAMECWWEAKRLNAEVQAIMTGQEPMSDIQERL